jgi:hypothetical protein
MTNPNTDLSRFDKIRDLNALELEGTSSLGTHEKDLLRQLGEHRNRTSALMTALAGQVAEGYSGKEIMVSDGALWKLKDEYRVTDEPETAEETTEAAPEAPAEDNGATPTPLKSKRKRAAK